MSAVCWWRSQRDCHCGWQIVCTKTRSHLYLPLGWGHGNSTLVSLSKSLKQNSLFQSDDEEDDFVRSADCWEPLQGITPEGTFLPEGFSEVNLRAKLVFRIVFREVFCMVYKQLTFLFPLAFLKDWPHRHVAWTPVSVRYSPRYRPPTARYQTFFCVALTLISCFLIIYEVSEFLQEWKQFCVVLNEWSDIFTVP